MVKFYLWYRDAVFFLHKESGKINWEEFEDFDDFIKPKLEEKDIHEFCLQVINDIKRECHNHYPVFSSYPNDINKKIKSYLDQKMKCGTRKRIDSIIYMVLISIGRTIDILALNVTKDADDTEKFKKIWAADAQLNDMDPLFDLFQDDNKQVKDQKLNKEATDLKDSGNKASASEQHEQALDLYFQSMNKNNESGSFLWAQTSNAIITLNKLTEEMVDSIEIHQEKIKNVDYKFIYQLMAFSQMLGFESTMLRPDRMKSYFNNIKLEVNLCKLYKHYFYENPDLKVDQVDIRILAMSKLTKWTGLIRTEYCNTIFKDRNVEKDKKHFSDFIEAMEYQISYYQNLLSDEKEIEKLDSFKVTFGEIRYF